MGIRQLLVSVLLSAVGSGQVNVWMPRGPEGGLVSRPVLDPQNPATLYAGAGGRLLKTTDAAGHWSDLGALPAKILAVDPRDSNTLYGSSNNVPFKSTDGGLTWNPAGAFPIQCGNFALVIDPGNPGT